MREVPAADAAVTVSAAVATSLPGTGSVENDATRSVLESDVPAGVSGATRTTISAESVSPTGSPSSVHTMSPVWGSYEHGHDAGSSKITPGGRSSSNTTPTALSGPLLVAVTV